MRCSQLLSPIGSRNEMEDLEDQFLEGTYTPVGTVVILGENKQKDEPPAKARKTTGQLLTCMLV